MMTDFQLLEQLLMPYYRLLVTVYAGRGNRAKRKYQKRKRFNRLILALIFELASSCLLTTCRDTSVVGRFERQN